MKAALAEHQRTDDQQIGEVEDNAGGEGRRVKARVIIDRAGQPPAAMPEPLQSSKVGTRHDASLDG